MDDNPKPEDVERLEKVKRILKSHGITMAVFGCNCCSNPDVYFEYNGEVILGNKDGHAWGAEGRCSFDNRDRETVNDQT